MFSQGRLRMGLKSGLPLDMKVEQITLKKPEINIICWSGLNPDDPAILETLKFNGPLAVNSRGKLTLTWVYEEIHQIIES